MADITYDAASYLPYPKKPLVPTTTKNIALQKENQRLAKEAKFWFVCAVIIGLGYLMLLALTVLKGIL